MALLANLRNSLRFSLELATYESVPMLTRTQAVAAEQADVPRSKLGLPVVGEGGTQPAPQRLLASVSMDFYDMKDREFWPFVRQAVLWLGPRDAHDLVEGVSRLVRDEVPGFAYRSAGSELAVQVGKAPEPVPAQAVFAVEIGLDLAAVLNEAAGSGNERGDALSLFRFATGQPQLVAFGRQLSDELAMLEGTQRGEKSTGP